MHPLSKTDFVLYRECPNDVWVKIHEPDEYAKFPISDFEKSLGEMGNEAERLARGMFPGGVMVEIFRILNEVIKNNLWILKFLK